MWAPALFPQLPHSLIPVVVKEGENLLQLIVVNRSEILSQLEQSELRLGVPVRMVEDMHQLPDNAAETADNPLILAFQFCAGLLVLRRSIGGFFEEAPTQRPQRLGQVKAFLLVLCVTMCLDPPAVGE